MNWTAHWALVTHNDVTHFSTFRLWAWLYLQLQSSPQSKHTSRLVYDASLLRRSHEDTCLATAGQSIMNQIYVEYYSPFFPTFLSLMTEYVTSWDRPASATSHDVTLITYNQSLKLCSDCISDCSNVNPKVNCTIWSIFRLFDWFIETSITYS